MLEELLGSKCRKEILKSLFVPDSRPVYLRGLARQTKLSCPALLRELRQLAFLNLIIAEQDGNMVKYSANHAHYLFPALSDLVLKTEGEEGILRRAFNSIPAEAVFIFGSVAKKIDSPKSDLDICVVGDVDLLSVSKIVCEIAEQVTREINPYVLTKMEWKRRVKAGDHFLKDLIASPKIFLKGGEDVLTAMAC